MLGEGLRAGLAHMGVSYRTVCHIEREAYAGGVLAARMEEGSLDAAPIWSDVCTFDAQAWRGRVDCIVAGFPCQDLSVAGRRAGLDGKRSGLFFEVTRIATDSEAWLMLLENVGGIATATASVVDPEEGELDERAAARVVGELADLGWDAEWITLSASDVGASHGRARWFCLAWRVVDAGRDGGTAVANALRQRADRPTAPEERSGGSRSRDAGQLSPSARAAGGAVADAGGHGLQRGAECDLGSLEPGQQASRGRDAERRDSHVADTCSSRSPIRARGGSRP